MQAASRESGVIELEDYHQVPHDQTFLETGLAPLDLGAVIEDEGDVHRSKSACSCVLSAD